MVLISIKPKRFNARAARRRLDVWWSQLVRARDDYTCQWGTTCGGVRDDSPFKMQAAHIHGKKANPNTRHDIDCGITLCVGCHFIADHAKRVHFYEFCRSHLLLQVWERLISAANAPTEVFNIVEYERRKAVLIQKASELGVKLK